MILLTAKVGDETSFCEAQELVVIDEKTNFPPSLPLLLPILQGEIESLPQIDFEQCPPEVLNNFQLIFQVKSQTFPLMSYQVKIQISSCFFSNRSSSSFWTQLFQTNKKYGSYYETISCPSREPKELK